MQNTSVHGDATAQGVWTLSHMTGKHDTWDWLFCGTACGSWASFVTQLYGHMKDTGTKLRHATWCEHSGQTCVCTSSRMWHTWILSHQCATGNVRQAGASKSKKLGTWYMQTGQNNVCLGENWVQWKKHKQWNNENTCTHAEHDMNISVPSVVIEVQSWCPCNTHTSTIWCLCGTFYVDCEHTSVWSL